ncbi:MAG: hypothetical protein U0575_07425 [Phycisphaerales bacterium]
MATTKTGVDIVLSLTDEASAKLQSTVARIRSVASRSVASRSDGASIDSLGDITNTGARGGGVLQSLTSISAGSPQIPTGLVKGIGAVAIIHAVDSLMNETLKAIAERKTGAEVGLAIGQNVADTLRKLPILGPLGEFIPKGLGWLSGGGFSTFEERQKALEPEREEALRLSREADLRAERKAQGERFREQQEAVAAERAAELQRITESRANEREFDEQRMEDQQALDEQQAENERDLFFDEISYRTRRENEAAQQDAARRAAEGALERAQLLRESAGRLSPTVESRFGRARAAIFQGTEAGRADAALQTAKNTADMRALLQRIAEQLPQTVELVN